MESLAQSVLKLYMEMDINLYDKCSRERQDKMKDKEIMREQAAAKWDEITKLAAEKGLCSRRPILSFWLETSDCHILTRENRIKSGY